MHLRKFFFAVLLLGGLGFGSSPVFALCVTPEEQGTWKNIDPNTRSITWAQIRLTHCGDQVLNGVLQPTLYSVHLWGKCHPTDCDWGVVTGRRDGEWIRATYSFGFKTSSVWTKTYHYNGRIYLRVYVWNDFHDARTDYASDEWFLSTGP